MRLFRCQNCGNALHFDNTLCVNCGHAVGYIQDRTEMTALEPDGVGWKALADPDRRYFYCRNVEYDVCNWLVTGEAPSLCEACRRNRVVPDLNVPGNLQRWQKIELAKRYLFRSLLRWNLPMPDRAQDPKGGLVFDLEGDVTLADGSVKKIQTGHEDGLITLNIAEADDAERESRRAQMGETYRTLIGHFRHEIGHYFWDRLVRDGGRLETFRALFGNEEQNYQEALKRHYEAGPPADWRERFISAYATTHPWEDFAETWAHYLHIVDALATARAYGIDVKGDFAEQEAPSLDVSPYDVRSCDLLLKAWVPLTIAINSVNRSMGQPDLYPFVLSSPVVEKLSFIHDLIHEAAIQNSSQKKQQGVAT